MWLRLTLDDPLQVREVAAVTDAGPYAICPAITPAFGQLKGLTVGRGWRREVLARLGGVRGCTHLVELLWPMATAAYQTIYPVLARERAAAAESRPPAHLDSCHALARDGEVVREAPPALVYRQPCLGRCGSRARLGRGERPDRQGMESVRAAGRLRRRGSGAGGRYG